MSTIVDKKTLEVFQDVIVKIITEAVDDIKGVKLVETKKTKSNIVIDFLPSDRVDVTLLINVDLGVVIPNIVATVQERVIKEIEKVTKYKVHSANVTVVGVEND